MPQNPWFIIGAGAIGCHWAARFEDGNIPYQLLCKASQQSVLEEQGIVISKGDQCTPFSPATSIIGEYKPEQPISKLIICTKAFQTHVALNSIAEHIAKDATVIILQNGLGSFEWLQQQFPQAHIYNATTTDGVHGGIRPFHFTIAGVGETWLGQLGNEPRNDDIDTLLKQCAERGIHLQWDQNIKLRLWQKLAINCAINGLTVIHNCRNGQLLENPDALSLMKQLCAELDLLLNSQLTAPQGDCFDYAQQIARTTANNVSSMLQDYQQQRPGELEAIYGYAIEQAKLARLDLPQLNRLYQQLKKKFDYV